MKSNIKKFSQIVIVSIVTAVMALAMQPAAQVFAMSPADDITPPQVTPLPESDGSRVKQAALAKLFQVEEKTHERQQGLINKADKGANRLSELIARAKENGKDTSNLEKALAVFNTKLGEIRLTFDQTGRLIKQHAGFDDQGKVTDPEIARKTAEDVRKGNQEVRQMLTQAVKALREAGQEFRKANPRPSPTPVANPA
jgi:hypothetical protein